MFTIIVSRKTLTMNTGDYQESVIGTCCGRVILRHEKGVKMAKKFGKFLAFTAVVGAACGAVYYVLGKKDSEPLFFHNQTDM